MAVNPIDAVNTYRAVQSTADYSRPQDAQAPERAGQTQTAPTATEQAAQSQSQNREQTSRIYLLDENLGQHVNILA